MYYKYMDALKFFRQPKVTGFIRLSSMLIAVAMLLNELQQGRSYSWYFAFLYCFFLIPSLYFTRENRYRHFFHMRDVLKPFRIYTVLMTITYLVLYIHQIITY
ncbi:hypothetical protein SHPE106448_15425 [Shewanella pealeana]